MEDTFAPAPVASRSPLADHAYTMLHGAILRGEIPPGTVVRETELARRLKISRTPVREALRRLLLEGFLTRTPSGGLMVSEVSSSLIIEAFDLRKVLEGFAARRAATVFAERDAAHLSAIVEDSERALSQEAYSELSLLNDRFHGYIEELANNSLLRRTIQALREQIAVYGAFAFGGVDQQRRFIEGHRAILAALRANDPAEAESLAVDHLDAALKLLLETVGEGQQTAAPDSSGSEAR